VARRAGQRRRAGGGAVGARGRSVAEGASWIGGARPRASAVRVGLLRERGDGSLRRTARRARCGMTRPPGEQRAGRGRAATLGIVYHMPFWQTRDGAIWEAEGSFARYVESLAPY